MNHRNEFGKLLVSRGLVGRGVEVGSYEGGYANIILSTWPGDLYMVDVWNSLPKEEYDDNSNKENYIEIYSKAIKNIENFKDRAFMLRMKSEKAIELFPDNSLDFVYIDANHKYENVIEDIKMWYPKVKSNGIVAGHDYLKCQYDKGVKNLPIYMWNNNTPTKQTYMGMFGVNPAVDEFCETYGYEFNQTEEWLGSWWFIKR